MNLSKTAFDVCFYVDLCRYNKGWKEYGESFARSVFNDFAGGTKAGTLAGAASKGGSDEIDTTSNELRTPLSTRDPVAPYDLAIIMRMSLVDATDAACATTPEKTLAASKQEGAPSEDLVGGVFWGSKYVMGG